jgi:hypothetical protein
MFQAAEVGKCPHSGGRAARATGSFRLAKTIGIVRVSRWRGLGPGALSGLRVGPSAAIDRPERERPPPDNAYSRN